MNKKIISDILPPKRSIRQIPLSSKGIRGIERKAEDTKKEIFEEGPEDHVVLRTGKASNWQRKPLNPKFMIWLIAIICLLALFFGISIIFSSATITIIPRTEKVIFTGDLYTAKADSASSTDLSFEVLKVKQTVEEIVSATEEKEVSQKATGKLVIYNNYSTVPQRLINNTRFEANNGKIYRISNSVIVPGLSKVDGKVIPGSIEAVVFADQAGENYNLKLADLAGDFKIPGFKGDPRYTGFYGRLKTDILGGFIGKQSVVDDSLRESTEVFIKEKLKEQLLKELYAIKPENYLVFKDGYSIDYNIIPDMAIENNKVKIRIEGNLNAIVFNNSKLAKYIANKKLTGFDGLPVELVPADNLVVNLIGSDSSGYYKNSILQMKFSGEAVIKWLYNSDDIKKDLAGKKEVDIKKITTKYRDSITGIQVVFQPVWTRYFPDNLEKIRIKE